MQVTVFCEAAEKPDGWDDEWCGDGVKEVVWGAEIDDYFSYLGGHSANDAAEPGMEG